MKGILQQLDEDYAKAIAETARKAIEENTTEPEQWEKLGYKEKFGELRNANEGR